MTTTTNEYKLYEQADRDLKQAKGTEREEAATRVFNLRQAEYANSISHLSRSELDRLASIRQPNKLQQQAAWLLNKPPMTSVHIPALPLRKLQAIGIDVEKEMVNFIRRLYKEKFPNDA